MLIQIPCYHQGKIIVDVSFPYYFHREHEPFFDEHQVFYYTAGVILQDVCLMVTRAPNKRGQDSIVFSSETYDCIAESKILEFLHPLHQSTKEQFEMCLHGTNSWFKSQFRFLATLTGSHLP